MNVAAARPLLEILSFDTCHGSSMTQNFENVFYYFSSVEWHQLSTASASKRLHTLVTRSLQLGCKSPSEKTLAIFFALVFFEQEALFGDVEQTRRAFFGFEARCEISFQEAAWPVSLSHRGMFTRDSDASGFFCDGKHI